MRWFYNLKTTTKLVLGFSAVSLLVAGMGYVGVRATLDLKESLRIVYADYTVAATDLGAASNNLTRCRQSVLSSLDATDAEALARLAADRKVVRDEVVRAVEAYAATTLRVSRDGRDERKDFEAFHAALLAYVADADETITLMQRSLTAATPAEADALRAQARELALTKTPAKLTATVSALDELMVTVKTVAEDMNAAGEATAERSFWTMIVGTALTAAAGLVLGLVIARIIARPLAKAVGVLGKVAAGDFNVRLDVDTKDEVGQMAAALNATVQSVRASLGEVRGVLEKVAAGDFTAKVASPDEHTEIGKMAAALNRTVEAVRSALSDVREVADSVASASTQLSSASEEISSGAQEQAASLEETASSLEEITSTVKQNADSAQQASQLAAGARDAAEKGGEVVAGAVRAMAEINEASKKIGAIITTIDEIAFQTNLLALNAAVEAARAGEQGRGFAVVAGEVRSLAQRSAGAAKEIKELIGDSVRKVEAGSELVSRSGRTLDEIIVGVKRTTDVVGEIAAASSEQANGVDQVSRAVAQMDAVTQANAGQTEELSGTAEGLAGQAQQLQQLVGRFKLGGDAGTVSAGAHAGTPKAASGSGRPRPAVKPAATPVGRKSATNGHANGRSNGHAVGRKRDGLAAEHELDLVGVGAAGRFGGVEEF